MLRTSMKALHSIILAVIFFALTQEMNVNAVTMTERATFFAPPQTSIICNDFKEDTPVKTKTPYSCNFDFSVVWSEDLINQCSLEVYDSTTNKSFASKNFSDIVTSKVKEDEFFEYNVSYPIAISFDEEGTHRVSFDVNCEFWKGKESPTLKVFNVESMSPTSFLQYRLVKEQLDIQKKANEEQIKNNDRTYTISIITALTALLGIIGTAYGLLRRDNKRIVEISKINDKLELKAKRE